MLCKALKPRVREVSVLRQENTQGRQNKTPQNSLSHAGCKERTVQASPQEVLLTLVSCTKEPENLCSQEDGWTAPPTRAMLYQDNHPSDTPPSALGALIRRGLERQKTLPTP